VVETFRTPILVGNIAQIGECMWPVIVTAVLKLKDFSRWCAV